MAKDVDRQWKPVRQERKAEREKVDPRERPDTDKIGNGGTGWR